MSNIDRNKVHADLIAAYGPLCTRENFADYAAKTGIDPRWLYYTPAARSLYRVGRGQYRVPSPDGSAPVVSTPVVPVARKAASTRVSVPRETVARETVTRETVTPVATVASTSEPSLALAVHAQTSKSDILSRIRELTAQASDLASVPTKNSAFVAFGDFDVVRRIIASNMFHPVFITGLSGNGKTFQIRQACALEGREFIRVNITAETDEDDLIGGFRLKNGETVFELGPVVVAMLRGAVLLIDEIDLASPKILCLQSIMEGNELVIKKLGITIQPAVGFTVFATANTKGRGSADGKFVGANLLNEAFLERFPITIEQAYPSVKIEQKILAKTYEQLGGTNTPDTLAFFERLSKWADGIRATYFEEGIEDLVATRRLVHIVKTFHIFGSIDRALSLCLNRFDPQVKAQFLDLWAKLSPEDVAGASATATVTEDIPF